jgi:hypothetical protein
MQARQTISLNRCPAELRRWLSNTRLGDAELARSDDEFCNRLDFSRSDAVRGLGIWDMGFGAQKNLMKSWCRQTAHSTTHNPLDHF